MRKLDRASVTSPPCLKRYRHGVHDWKDVTGDDKAEIRSHLARMQGNLCAYCEGNLDDLGDHVDHFRPKRRFPRLMFSWANLFWSCDYHDSCGHYKDSHEGYSPDEILDPCADDPDDFFRYRADGSIDVRKNLSAQNERRARETLRVFNLDAKRCRLRMMRRRYLAGFAALVDEGHGLSPAQLQELFAAELIAAESGPFSTAVRHVLTQL